MQQKPRISLWTVIALLVIALLVGGTITLMTVNIPAPQHAVEKQLDAKAFFEQKQ